MYLWWIIAIVNKLILPKTGTGQSQIHSNLSHWCPTCHKGFTDIVILRNHSITEHNVNLGDKLPFECSICNERFANIIQLENHKQKHDAKHGRHECEFCGYIGRSLDRFRDHLRSHTGDKPYKCEICKKCYSNKEYFEVHKKSHNRHSYMKFHLLLRTSR